MSDTKIDRINMDIVHKPAVSQPVKEESAFKLYGEEVDIKRPLTADDFFPAYPPVTDLPICYGEDGDWFGYGHINSQDFADAVNKMSDELGENIPDDEKLTSDDIIHWWAVTTESPDDNPDNHFRFSYCTEGTSQSWPVTYFIS